MAAKRNYSRCFIILQEDEKGYSRDNNKFPTGYAKIERKNDKCKISYYIQNLKQIEEPYNMVLISDKKGDKRLINIGTLPIDSFGRAETSQEYDASNVANCNIPIDTIKGAAVAKLENSRVHGVLAGFINGAKLEDWKSYAIIENKKRAEETNKIEKVKEASNTLTKNDGIKENPEGEKTSKNRENNVFDEYENHIEAIKNIELGEEKDSAANVDLEVADAKQLKKDREVEDKQSENSNNKDGQVSKIQEAQREIQGQVLNSQEFKANEQRADKVKEDDFEERQPVEKVEKVDLSPENSDLEDNCNQVEDENFDFREDEDSDLEMEDGEVYNETNYETNYESYNKEWNGTNDDGNSQIGEKEYKDNETRSQEEDEEYPKGSLGSFFRTMTNGLEEVKNVCLEVGKCRWYKVSCKEFMTANPMEDFNKYYNIYYPMNNYYPYIKRKGHYLVGCKCDKKGNMRYLVYAIPGTRSIWDQPFGGTTGFVTWTYGNSSQNRHDDSGYWLMFYDIKNSTVVVPVKK